MYFLTKNKKNKPNMNLFKIDLETLEKEQLTFGEHNFYTHPLYQP